MRTAHERLVGSTLARPYEFVSPFDGREFAAWIMAADPSLTAAEQDRIADALVQQGCRYAVCSGLGCSSWDDAIDYAVVFRKRDAALPADHCVMTTWHEKEATGEIAEFFAAWAHFDGFAPERWLVLGIGNEAGSSVLRAQALTEPLLPSG